MSDEPTLAAARVATRLPAQDLERARAWYREKLGLEPAETRDGGLLYHCASGSFSLFASAAPHRVRTRRWRGKSTTCRRRSRSFAHAA